VGRLFPEEGVAKFTYEYKATASLYTAPVVMVSLFGGAVAAKSKTSARGSSRIIPLDL
jgi:hypothetical protein